MSESQGIWVSNFGDDQIEWAFKFAKIAHGNQIYGNHPYEFHLKMVYDVAVRHDLPFKVLFASPLHDVLEDTSCTFDGLAMVFGKDLADLVFCVTDEPGKNRKERKAKTYPKIQSDANAIALKLCDRIANVTHCLNDDNKSLLGMYKKEQSEFETQLKEHNIYPKLWDELEELLK